MRQWVRSFSIFMLALSFVLDHWRLRAIRRFSKGERRERAQARVFSRAGTRFRRFALRRKGLIVKVGQYLSARADIFPVSFTRELNQLQDAVPPNSFSSIEARIESELGAKLSTLFVTFERTALAAASLGQVHKATLPGGQIVAVKVLRPGIERLAEIDLSALRSLARFMQRFTKFGRRLQVWQLYVEFSRITMRELDYRIEAENLQRFRKHFQDKGFVIPALIQTLVSRRVLVMEFIDGVRVTDVHHYLPLGISPIDVAKRLIDAYLQQVLEFGFVHVDPHPGNLLVLADGRVAFIDFGMMVDFERQDVKRFAALVTAALARDLDGVVRVIDELGFLQPYADREVLKKAIAFMLDRMSGLRLTRGPELDAFLEEFQSFLHDEPLIMQGKYLFIGRALGLASGVVTTLWPQINWLEIIEQKALPLLNRTLHDEAEQSAPNWKDPLFEVIRNAFGEKGVTAAEFTLVKAREIGLSLVRIPPELDRVLQKIERDEFVVQIEMREILKRLDRQHRRSERLLWFVFFLLGSSAFAWFHMRHWPIAQGVALVASSISLLSFLVNLFRS
ncbi:ABC1 kinase family protein [Sulfoacidibacillus thermotolerans]|uniref:Protein kinase domain-containing protein n=1 Tax=Sulfoacidibacillus thermotolerans TaxID=1765684 RepID=A0A2U3D939_SULT2|nr:AarF/UbiB family protein [Sulfoacidibacillus thermotolerans]PWI57802.1 hypothetical protein BM613_06305 [Sulfoacidibacillus thermotolerans]